MSEEFDRCNAFLKEMYEHDGTDRILSPVVTFQEFRAWVLHWRWASLRAAVEAELPDWSRPEPSTPERPIATGTRGR